jgi:hypothetical protein
MGSSCCKNVRVVGIPQQEPINVTNTEEYYKKSTLSIPPPIPIGFDGEKNNSQSTVTYFPQHHNSEEEEKKSISFRFQKPKRTDEEDKKSSVSFSFQKPKVTNEYDQPNDRKRITSSQFPPIRRQKSANDQRISIFTTTSLAKWVGTERIDNQTTAVRLPSLEKSVNFENDDNLVESVSYESNSNTINRIYNDWHLQTIPDGNDFYVENRFYTSTPIPQSSERSDSDQEYLVAQNYLIGPLANYIGSEEHLSDPLNTLQMLQVREQTNLDEAFQTLPIPDLKISPQYLFSVIDQGNLPMIRIKDPNESDISYNSTNESISDVSNTPTIINDKNNTSTKLSVVHPEAFDETFNMMRQHVIDNNSYRLIIEAWRPNSIEQLVDQIKNFASNKPTIDRLWIVFYWIARNIEYDTVPYVGKKHADKSAEAVFRTRKAIADGYANLFQRLCNDLDLICDKVHGYAKMYVFDPCNKSSVPIDHTWNAVQTNHYWYLIDLTWSAGHLENSQIFKREFNSYYFLSRPNEMIYHHFPALERWQLLKQSIKMAQYMQMPKLWPQFFQCALQLISPSDTIHVDLDPRQSFATVLIQASRNISLGASFTLNEKEVDGGHRIVFDNLKRVYRCYFAPASIGVHIIRFFAKNDNNGNGSYNIVAELDLDIRQMPSKPISYPKTWKSFFELNLEIISPYDTHLIKMDHGDTHTEILIRAPSDVELVGRLTVDNSVRIPGGNCTFFDRKKVIWRCLFAPPRDGLFEAFILAKRRLDPGTFAIAARFRIKANRKLGNSFMISIFE